MIEGFCLRCGVNEFFFELTGWIFLVLARAMHHYVHLTKLKTPIAIRNLVLAKLQFEGVVLLFPVLLISALWLARFTYFQTAHVMNLEHRYFYNLMAGVFVSFDTFRAISAMEEDPFKRYIMHTYGARGVAMVRVLNGPSGDSELDKLARQFVGFHCDEKNFKVSNSKDECFLDHPGGR